MSERVAQDARVYRKTIRPRLVGRVSFNSPQEHSFMHDFFVHRGLKVAESPYSHYDETSHTFYHPTPNDKPAVAKAYLRWMEPGAVKLARGDETERGFQAAIAENPQESHNHLVYADWLDEHGAHEDAAFRRSIGEWHQKPRDLTPPPPTYAADLGPSALANKMRFWVHRDDLPPGITNADIPLWAPGTHADHFDPRGTGYWPRDRVHAAFDYSRGHQGFRWGTYQHLEQAFRRAWDAGRLRSTHLERVPGLGAATRAQQTDTHSTRLSVVRQILGEAGVHKAVVRSMLAHTDARGVRPGVSVAIGEPVSKPLARYLGAWLGLMTGERKMTVFHPGAGEDTLHVIDSPHDTTHVSSYLKSAGVPSFSVEKSGTGTRVFIVDPMDLIDVQHAAGGLQATKQAQVTGTAVRLGANDSDSSARSNYRQVIQDAEGASAGPQKLARKPKVNDPRAHEEALRGFMQAIRPRHTQIPDPTYSLGYRYEIDHSVDRNAHLALADWIRDVTGNPADPRALVVEKHEDRPRDYAAHGGLYLHTVGPPYGDRPGPVYPTGHARRNGLFVQAVGPYPPPAGSPEATHAIVEWRLPVPAGRYADGRSTGITRSDYHTFSARLEPHELHDLIDQLPKKHQQEWRDYATRSGLHDTRDKPQKLARPAKADFRNRDNFLPLLEAARAHLHHPFGVTAPDQAAHGALADLIGEITGNPADPRAQLLRLVKHNDVHDFVRLPDNRRLYRYGGPVSRTAPAVYGTGTNWEHGLALTDNSAERERDHHPVVRWTVPIKGRDYHTFSAHVQPHELYNIIDQLPADHKARWEQYAQERGWHRPVETKPVKLAAISPPSSAQPSVIVKVPTPVPVQQTAKPRAPERPVAPSTGPTLIFPG